MIYTGMSFLQDVIDDIHLHFLLENHMFQPDQANWYRYDDIYLIYPLVNVYITMENHNVSWENSLYMAMASIAM